MITDKIEEILLHFRMVAGVNKAITRIQLSKEAFMALLLEVQDSRHCQMTADENFTVKHFIINFENGSIEFVKEEK